MQVFPLGGPIATDASGAYWWPNLRSVQVAPPPGGQNLQIMDET